MTAPETAAPERNPRRRALLLYGGVAVLFAAVGVGAGALLASVAAKKEQARIPSVRVVQITDEVEDPAVWGKDFPLEFDLYRKTTDMTPTKYAGSKALPHAPTDADPRTFVAREKIEADPRLKTMWDGYAFSVDYRERRGHAYMLEDQMYTERQHFAKQPGTCIHCHASVYLPYKRAGGGDLMAGFDRVNRLPYAEARKLVEHPVSCIDCHDPGTMALRVTRPGFLEGIRAYKASQGVANYDPNTMASRQEMRAYVCGQCHVEYYFKGPEKRLTYPWSKGLQGDRILDYYDEIGFRDWTHKGTGAAALKAQHPEFETWSQGIHARSGVSCADCHMPYLRVGGTKVSDHWVRSPLLNVNRACQGCHKWPEEELKARVEAIQDRHAKLRDEAMTALVGLIGDLEAAKAAGRAEADLAPALYLQRRASFLLDFVDAENSTGFHAPQESARLLGESIDMSRQGQVAVRDPRFEPSVAVVSVPPPPAPPAAAPAPAPAR